MDFTEEQQYAIATRDGSLLLAAGAGSGKTSVVVERFVRLLLDDGLTVPEILAITFTEKAAGELGERIRAALRRAQRTDLAHAAESAWISTIHGFCARILREHALVAGLDPEFAVLEPDAALQLRHDAFAAALRAAARTDAGRELIAAYGPARLRRAIVGVFLTLRSQGQEQPRLPVVLAGSATPDGSATPGEVAAPAGPDESSMPGEVSVPVGPDESSVPGEPAAAQDLIAAAGAALRELAAAPKAAKRVTAAMAMLETVPERLGGGVEWPGELDAIKLGTGAKALTSETCERYRTAWASLRGAALARLAVGARDGLDALLRDFGERYAQAKRDRSAVDFEDLELRALALLRRPAIAAQYQQRFRAVMVDEMQDTNAVQLELIELVAADHLFMVGDAQQSIYGFRHADVELFLSHGRELARNGASASLRTNFRSAPELLEVVNRCFEGELGDEFMALEAGRAGSETEPRTPPGPRVELILAERLDLAARRQKAATEAADAGEQLDVTPWRLAEARALAARVADLVTSDAAAPQDVVLLARASTDLGAYERALAEQGLPTQLLAGRGFWQNPQVAALVAYLRALANPLDEPAYYATLLSPACGLSLDGALLLRAGAREQLGEADAARLDDFERWFAGERRAAARSGAELLLDHALARNGYLRQIAAAVDGDRRLANVRKLQRIARDWELGQGGDLRALLTALELRASADEGVREGEASVAADAGDAVRLMTIHAAKGLEFPVVCVVDLGRGSPGGVGPLIRVGRDGQRLGFKLGRPGSGELLDALDYEALAAEQREREAAEERRLFYVAMTRARERLILSGAALLGGDFAQRNRLAPIGWLAPALVPGIAELGPDSPEPALLSGGVRVSFVPAAAEDGAVATASAARAELSAAATPSETPAASATPTELAPPAPIVTTPGSPPLPSSPFPSSSPSSSSAPASGPAPARLSYSALAAYERCGYRFYLERMLQLGYRDTSPAADTGIAVHDLLRKLDLADPERSLDDAGLSDEALALARAFVNTELAARLAAAPRLRREQPFTFLVSGILVSGVFDAVAVAADGSWLIADYKTDRLAAGDDPELLVADRYSSQQLIYALAALLSGAARVEVEHLFLRAPERPVIARYDAMQVEQLRTALERRLAPLEAGRYPVTDSPGYRRCDGCPAADGLCPYPRELTRR